MDYSLLVGIHDVVRGNQDHIRDQTLSVFEPNAETLSRRATAATRQSKAQIVKEGLKTDLQQLGPSSSKLPDNIPPEYFINLIVGVDIVFFTQMKVDFVEAMKIIMLASKFITLE
jgi:hypothetical protein